VVTLRTGAAGSRDVILLGPPGAGKGTQARLLVDRFGFETIATGDLLRAAVGAQSALGRKAAAIMAGGGLVDDDVIVRLVEERLHGVGPNAAVIEARS
jgi:adenylate kinase